GIAWIGFADERRKQTRSGSPQLSPSVVATWTRCTASTTCPLRTVTLSASTARGAYVARVARGRGMAPPARPARQEVADREGGPPAHRDAEDDRAAVDRARR